MSNFPVTRWSSVVQLAAIEGRKDIGEDTRERASQALNALCEIYWRPIYAYARMKVKSPEDAQDLTQTFFLELLRKNLVARADRQMTKFRTFLLAQLDYVRCNEWRRQHVLKRGGGVEHWSFNFEDADEQLESLLAAPADPAAIYQQVWANEVVEQVLKLLREDYAAHNPDVPFEALKGYLPGGGACERLPYEELTRRYPGHNVGALKTRVSRLKKRFQELLRAVVADTLCNPDVPGAPADPAAVEEEIKDLVQVLIRT